MGVRNSVGTGLQYRPARLHRLAKSIPRIMKSWKIPSLTPVLFEAVVVGICTVITSSQWSYPIIWLLTCTLYSLWTYGHIRTVVYSRRNRKHKLLMSEYLFEPKHGETETNTVAESKLLSKCIVYCGITVHILQRLNAELKLFIV